MLSGVDAKLVNLKNSSGGTYKTCVGPNVVYEGSYEEFSEIYNESIEVALEEAGVERKNSVYKSYEVLKEFAEQKEEMLNFLETFIEELFSRDKVELRVAYSRFSKNQLPEGKVRYYDSSNTNKKMELNDFIDDLKSYFPAIAAFETLEANGDDQVYLDNFNGQVTKAWDSLINSHKVHVLTNGDKVNRLVSTSDLVVKYIEIYINRYENGWIDNDMIKDVLGIESIEVVEVTNSNLPYIVPHRPDNISVSRYYPQPMFFVLLDHEFEREKEWFENSKYYDLVCRAAESRMSAVKFLDIDSDYQMVTSDDFLVFTGQSSKQEAERISKFDLGKPISVENIEDIM